LRSKSSLALLTALGMVALLVAACGSSSGSTTQATATSSAGYHPTYTYKAPTHTGGNLVFGEYEAVDTLNPLTLTAEVDVKNDNALLGTCLVQLPDASLGSAGFMPDQCAQVPTAANGGESSDGKTTTVKLQPNSKFDDGTPVTADDWLLYLDLLTDPNAVGDPYPWSSYFKSATYVDPNTFTINWSSSFGPYLAELNGIFPLPVEDFPSLYNTATHTYKSPGTSGFAQISSTEKWNFTFHSNGPYMLQSHSTNSEVYVKNPNYHSNFFHGPFLDQVVFKSEGDINTTVEAFKTGQLNQADDFVVTQLPVIQGAGIAANETIVTPAVSYEHFDFNLRNVAPNAKDANNPNHTSIFANQMVRKAFIEAFNSCSALIAIVNAPSCSDPALYTAENTAPPAPDFDPTTKLVAYNVAQAQADLASAGFAGCKYSNGNPITINLSSTSGNTTRAAYLNLAAQEWNLNLGCKTTVTTYPSSTYFASYTSQGTLAIGDFDVALFAFVDGLTPALNDPEWQSTNIPGPNCPSCGNYQGIQDSTMDQDISQMLSTTNIDQANAIGKQFMTYFTSQYYNIPLYIRANVGLATPTLQNYLQNPGSAGNTWNIADWWLSS
jgi:peptide/nickel transport system substrate-binding protein